MSRSIVQPLNLFIIILLAITWPVVATLEPKVDEVGHAPSGLYRARVALSQPTSRARLDELCTAVEAARIAEPAHLDRGPGVDPRAVTKLPLRVISPCPNSAIRFQG